MGQKIVGDYRILGTHLPDGPVKIDHVPVHNGGRRRGYQRLERVRPRPPVKTGRSGPAWSRSISGTGRGNADVLAKGSRRAPATTANGRGDGRCRGRRPTSPAGKLRARERVAALADPGSFREFMVLSGIRSDELEYFCDGRVDYRVRKASGPAGGALGQAGRAGRRPAYHALYRKSRCRLAGRQGPGERFRPELYVLLDADIGTALRRRIAALQVSYPGIAAEPLGSKWRIATPDPLQIGHDAAFAAFTRRFLGDVADPASLRPRDRPNLLAKIGSRSRRRAAAVTGPLRSVTPRWCNATLPAAITPPTKPSGCLPVPLPRNNPFGHELDT